jgi:AcrR family transcriptional regulator
VTLAQVARRAGVSEPTLYRHFGSREKLLEEIDSHAHGQLGLPSTAESLRGLPRQAVTLFEKFESHADLFSAATQAGMGKEMRAKGRKRRTQMVRELIAKSAPELDAAEQDRITAVIRVLVSWEAFRTMTTELGLSPGDASRAVAWALEALVDAVEEMPSNDRARSAAKTSPKGGTR